MDFTGYLSAYAKNHAIFLDLKDIEVQEGGIQGLA